ncbi:MAG: hypothetical protein K2X87_07155 [Gemmataceae bacterium]|nr:hypothetical protein [Gemmataceae bacterium]
MPLADDLVALRDSILADLDAAHDYHTDTLVAWQFARAAVERSEPLAYRNPATGSVTTGQGLRDKAERYLIGPLAASVLQQYLSLFEDFVLGLLRRWLLAYPMSIGRKAVTAADVFEAPDLEHLRLAIVDHEVRELGFKNVADWFARLNSLVKLGVPTDEQVRQLAELKATRDIFVHNRGVANAVYEEKAGGLKRFAGGERMDLPGDYLQTSWQLIRQVVAEVADAAISKAIPPAS